MLVYVPNLDTYMRELSPYLCKCLSVCSLPLFVNVLAITQCDTQRLLLEADSFSESQNRLSEPHNISHNNLKTIC